LPISVAALAVLLAVTSASAAADEGYKLKNRLWELDGK